LTTINELDLYLLRANYHVISCYTTKKLGHLGLVAGFCQEIGLASIIDRAPGTYERRQVSYDHIFTAMVLNGLGFTGRTLHMYSEFFLMTNRFLD